MAASDVCLRGLKVNHLAHCQALHPADTTYRTRVCIWCVPQGSDSAPNLALQALEEAKGSDLLFWASRYHLFVSWSPDCTHPWDALPAADQHVLLEIGVQRGTDKVAGLAWGLSSTTHCLSGCSMARYP